MDHKPGTNLIYHNSMTGGLRMKIWNGLLIITIMGIAILLPVSAQINADAVNNEDTYVSIGEKITNNNNTEILGIYGNGSRMNTIMSWTLPKGNNGIKEVALALYCQKWDNFPTTPVELRVLNEKSTSKNSTIVDSVLVREEGFYSWVLRGNDANNSLNSLNWEDTINVTLTLPDETGFNGIQCYSKEFSYNKPYLVVADEAPKIPLIINVTAIKVKKTSALINTLTDTSTTNILVNYGTNSSDLNLWSYADSLSASSYNLLAPLTPDTTYYYKVYTSNYIDNNYKDSSPVLSFTTAPDNNLSIPLVTFVFDDGWESTFMNASPVFMDFMFPGVSAVITDMPDKAPAYMNWTQIRELQNTYGWEIASHTKSHADMTSLNKSQMESELEDSKTTLVNNGLDIRNFISPTGAYNYLTEAYVMRYYDSDRIVTDGPINPPYNEFPLYAKHIQNTTTVSEVEGWVDAAVNNNSWLILVMHKIVDNNPVAEEWTKSDLVSLARYIESQGKLRVVTIREAEDPSFDLKGVYADKAQKNITSTISPDGTVYYSKTPTGHPRINAKIIPSSDPVSISIGIWNTTGDYKILFNESSTNASNEIRYELGDRQPDMNYSVKIYRDNGTLVNYLYMKSNSSGYLSYNTTGSGDPRYTIIQPAIPESPRKDRVEPAAKILGDYNELPATKKIIGIIAVIVIIGFIAYILRRFVR